ncbi:MAG: VOC family protein [Aureliella sp.]
MMASEENAATVAVTLDFAGRTEEALAFYASAANADVRYLLRFKDGPAGYDPRLSEKVLHSTFRIGATDLFAKDAGFAAGTQSDFAGFTLTVRTSCVTETQVIFSGLAKGGNVVMALTETDFAEQYGVVIDRFGITWNVMKH